MNQGQAAFDAPNAHAGGQAAFAQEQPSYTNFDAPPVPTGNSYSAFGSGVNNRSNAGGQAAFQPGFDAQQRGGNFTSIFN